METAVGCSSWAVLMAEFGKWLVGIGRSMLELICRCSGADPEVVSGTVFFTCAASARLSASGYLYLLYQFVIWEFRIIIYAEIWCEKHLEFESTLNSSLTFWTWLRQILVSPVNDMRCQWSSEAGLQWWQLLLCESDLCHWAVTLRTWQLLCHQEKASALQKLTGSVEEHH